VILTTYSFDDEQIWAQLQAYHVPLLKDLQARIENLNHEELNLLQSRYIEDTEQSNEDESDNDEENGDEVDERALRRAMTNNYDDDEDNDENDENDKMNTDNMNEDVETRAPEENIDEFINQMENKLDDIDDFEFEEEDKQEFNKDDAQALAELYGDDYDEEEEDDDDDDEPERPKTLFEEHQEKLLSEIEQLEEKNIADKDWQEIGEASSMKRPKNSLLEADLAFEHSSLVCEISKKN
jgi:U3 small nucleolar RNA-associated protein MPP10